MTKRLKQRYGMVETTVIRFIFCRFWRTDKAVEQECQCWWRVCLEINVFSRFKYCTFYVLYPFVTYLLTLLVPGMKLLAQYRQLL
jgi:hypothetical protein